MNNLAVYVEQNPLAVAMVGFGIFLLVVAAWGMRSPRA